MIIGHIGARKGSKGVPGKNFRPICGKPLIDWSLDQLFASPVIDAVVVSTDDEGIYAHALARGALPIGLRPAHLATDTAGKWGVWQHALAAAEQITGPATAFRCCLRRCRHQRQSRRGPQVRRRDRGLGQQLFWAMQRTAVAARSDDGRSPCMEWYQCRDAE